MTENKDNQPVQIQIKIVAVKMKIKFPCKMALEYNKQPITRQVSSTEGNKFLFNEDITLRGQTDGQTFEIVANLWTQKRTKYSSGVMKMLGGELMRSQGQRLIIPLTKCLDSDSFCQLKVQSVNYVTKSMLRLSRGSSKIINLPSQKADSVHELVKISSDKFMIKQTKSEMNSPVNFPAAQFDQYKPRQGSKTLILKSACKSPNSKYSNIKHVKSTYQPGTNGAKDRSQFPAPAQQIASLRPTLIQNDVIRQSYQKLKQKYKKQSQLAKEEAHKRMLLEANQNNYKLEVMKLKLKCEGLQKDVTAKNDKIKQMNAQLIDLQKKDLDMAYLKEQNLTIQTKIKLHEDTITNLMKDNENVKKMLMDKTKSKDETIASLRNQLQFAMAKLEEQKHESELQIKTKDAIIIGKNNDIKLRTETIQRQKKLIKQLEDQSEDKLFDFEKSISSQRSQYQIKIEDVKNQITSIQKDKIQLKNINRLLQEEIEKQKNTITVLEYNKKILVEQVSSLHEEIGQYKVMKQKYGQLQRQHKLLQEQFSAVRKQLQLSLQNKQVNINELMGRYDETKEKHDKSKTQYQQKIRSLILKTHELELIVQNNKNDLSKLQRINEALGKENIYLKKQNTTIRDELKSAEKRIISLQGDYSIHSSKYQRETANFTFLIQKYKSEKNSIDKQNDSLKEKNDKLEQLRIQFERKEQEWKIRVRHFQERIEKDSNKSKQTIAKYESIIKDNQTTISELKTTIQLIQNQIQGLRKKVNKNDLQEIKTKERQQRLKKEIKINSERLLNIQTQLKAKTEELLNQCEKNRILDSKIMEKELETIKLKQEIIHEQNKSGKQLQIAEMLNKDIIKCNNQIRDLHKMIQNKDKEQDNLRQDIKLCKQEVTGQKIKYNKKMAEFQKFKESINDIIRIEFARILKTPPSTQKSERLRESQVSNARSERSEVVRVKTTLDPMVISSTLAEKLHQTKNNLWKMIQLNKAFKEENNKLMEQFESQTSRHEFTKLQLNRDIEMLEDEMNELVNDKQVQSINYDNLVVQLNSQIKEKEHIIEDLRTQIDQYNAIINGFKTDFETNNDLNDKKVNSLKNNINELNQRIDYLNLNVACLEDKNHQLEQKVLENQNEIIAHKQMVMKYEKSTLDAQENQGLAVKGMQNLKKQHKALLEVKAELQILLNTEKEMKQKYMSMLQEEEKKTNKQNEFIAGLIVQKQSAVKNELEKSQEVNSLENKLFQNNHELQLLKEQNLNLKKKIEDFRQQIKIANKSIKTLEKQLAEQKGKNVRNLQKLKQKENDINIKRQYIKDLQQQYRQLRDKNYKEIKQLSNELQDKSTSSFNMNKELTDKIIKIEGENKKVWEDCVALKSQIQKLNVQLYEKRDLIQDLTIKIKKLEQERTINQQQAASKEFILHERNQEVQRLEQAYEQIKVSYHNISQQLQAYQKQFDINVQDITNECNFKLESLSKQHEKKIQIIAKEYDFAVKKLKQLQQEYQTLSLEKKSQQIEYDKNVKTYEQRIKKLQSKRFSQLQEKNNEIKQLSEDIKAHLSKIHQKQSEYRRINQQYQQLKLSTERSQQFQSYNLEQSKNKQKLLAKEIQSMKVKEQHSVNYRQNLLNYLYQNQVEVRKILSTTSKRIMETCSKDNAQKIMTILKGLQGNVVAAMMARIASGDD